MDDRDFVLPQQDIVEEIKAERKKEKKKTKYKRNKILFRVLAVFVFLVCVACGIVFSFTQTTMLTKELLVVTTKSFEVWRAVLFFIVGISCGACLWSVSEVFGLLDEKIK